MAALDTSVLAERIMTLERHLNRVAQLLPPNPEELLPLTEASDGVILHLWQAVQLVIDTALGACVHAYDKLDMTRIHEAARLGPNTLRDFFAALVKRVRS